MKEKGASNWKKSYKIYNKTSFESNLRALQASTSTAVTKNYLHVKYIIYQKI